MKNIENKIIITGASSGIGDASINEITVRASAQEF